MERISETRHQDLTSIQSIADMALCGIRGCAFGDRLHPAGSAALTPWLRPEFFPGGICLGRLAMGDLPEGTITTGGHSDFSTFCFAEMSFMQIYEGERYESGKEEIPVLSDAAL
jgi:hypothetical protein